jgi:hypothetical protein
VKPNGLLIAVALLAVLGGVVFWSNKNQASAGKSTTDASTKLLSIPDADIQGVRIKKLTGEIIDLKRAGSNKWDITKPEALHADPDAVSTLVSNLSTLNASKVIEDKAADLKPYGLDDPTIDILITKKDGKTDDLLIGEDTPTNSGAYAKLANDPRVVTIPTFVKSSLDKRVDDLRDKRLLTFDADKLTRVELHAKGQPVEFGKNASNEWQIVKPSPMRADNSAVDTLVNKLKDAKMDLTNPDTDADKKFAAAPRVAMATVTDASGSQTLEVHKSKDNVYYGKSTSVPGVHKLTGELGDGLDKGVDDFRNKKVFDFGFSDPNRLDVKGVTYAKSGDRWNSGAKTMDNASVQTLIDKLRDLSATKFVDRAGGDPVFDVTVTSNDNKRVEKVTIRKQGNQYFAQRENEPSIYELDPGAVDSLQKAAADIKEAAPPAPAKKK